MDKYRILQVIGEGTYGKVFKAQEKETGRVVAIKKFKQREDEDPHVRKTMMREIRILREYRHTNIVNLRDVFREDGKLYLIFDYVQKTLLEELQATPDGLPFERIKSITYQILQANNYLHKGNIIHRDIKPENLLISKAGIVKLCDFGFARPLNSSPTYQYTDYVSTRWYRAPELLVGDAAYSGTVDVWAIGCIFAEIFNGMPLFPGDSDLHTLQLILETITADDIEHDKEIQELSKKQRVAFRMNPLFEGTKVPLASESIKSPETVQEVSLKSLLKGINETQLDFVRKCLVIDGAERAKMTDLLAHPIFDDEFKQNFEAELQKMSEADEVEMQELAKTVLKTKDGREELNPEELVTEDEKNDEDDDEDEFDDDDSSSAVGSPGGSSSLDTPGSSSGVEHNLQIRAAANRDTAQYGGSNNESRDCNELQSVKTAVPPMQVGDGLLTSDKNSAEKLIHQNSMVSVTITNQYNVTKGDAIGASSSQEEDHSDEYHQNKMSSMNAKHLDNLTTPAEAEYHQVNTESVGIAMATQESLQSQKLLAKDTELAQNSGDEALKSVNEASESPAEPLQITKGVNGTASLVGVSSTQPSGKKENPKTEPAKKETNAEAIQDDANGGKNSVTPNPKFPAAKDTKDVKVLVSSSPKTDFKEGAAHVAALSGTTNSHQTPQKAQKRTSLNHYMIESSITEEIREENYSEKTSSASNQATPQKSTVKAKHNHNRQSSKSGLESSDHVIVREGVASMFQHPASMVVTEEGTENSPVHNTEANEFQLNNDGELESAAKHPDMALVNPGKIVVKTATNVTVTTKGTEGGVNSALSSQVAPVMSRAQTLGEVANAHDANGVAPPGAAGVVGDKSSTLVNSNPIALKQQYTEQVKQSGSSSLTATSQPTQQHSVVKLTQPSTNAAGSSNNPLISKVNITFGQQTQNPSINLQSAVSNAGKSNSRQLSSSTINQNNKDVTNTTNESIQAVQSDKQTQQQQPQQLAVLDSRTVHINQNSSRTNSNIPQQTVQQRSSISLKQANNSNSGIHQTAREFTPHKKPSLVAASPSTVQQHSFGVEGSGLRQNAMEQSTAAKTNQSRPGVQQNTALGQMEMSVTQFSGKPIYQVQQYPRTVVKGPGPKQATILKQTASVEKLDNRNASPHKLPNLKPINSSMSQYGQQMQSVSKQTVTSDDHRIGEGLTNLSNNHRPGPNSITNHFSSQQQRYPANSHSMNTQATGGKLASGSTQSLTTKLNFTSQNYHRASNSQTNETPSLHHLGANPGSSNTAVGITGPILHNQRGQANSGAPTTMVNSIVANSAKKSQLIHPLKLVAFPKLMANDEQSTGNSMQVQASPKNGIGSKKQSNVSNHNHPSAAIVHNLNLHQSNASSTNHTKTNHTLVQQNKNISNIQKKLPHNLGTTASLNNNNNHNVQQQNTSQTTNNSHNNMMMVMMSSKTQATKMPKRYSDMGTMSQNQQQAQQSTTQNNQSKFGASNIVGIEAAGPNGNTFHPTLTNEYMLSQDSLVLNDVNSRPSRQSSNNFEQPSISHINGKNQTHQMHSVESHRPRNQATSNLSSNTKSRGGAMGPQSHQVPANQSFHSTMKSKNNKFIHQNSSTSHHPTKGGASVNQSGILASSTATKAPPGTSDKRIHQHFLEEFSEATSQRASITRPKNATDSLGISKTHQKTPMTSLFQKSKFFQSQQSSSQPNGANTENTNPNSLNVGGSTGHGYHQQLITNHYGQQQQYQGGQSTSPHRSMGKQPELGVMSNFTDKDSFPRRNITNKLRNASNLQHKKTKFNQLEANQLHASTATSPSPLSLHQRELAKNGAGIVLPNLGATGLSAQPNGNQHAATAHANGNNAFKNVQTQHQQQHIMQVSLTQLHSTANDPRPNNQSQSPNIVRNKDKAHNLGTQKLSTVANVVQLNASEFNLRLTNNSQLSSSGGAVKGAMPYQQIVRKPPSVIQPGRAQQYQMYLTPSQNYTSGTTQSVANRTSQHMAAHNQKAGGPAKQAAGAPKAPGKGSSPTSLNKKISYENSFNVQKVKNAAPNNAAGAHRSPVINGGSISYKVKTETDWHRGSQQQLFDVASLGQSNQLYRVSNQLLEKSISPQRIQQAMKRGSNVQMMSSQGGIAIVGGPAASNYTENKTSFSNQQQKRRQTGATMESGPAGVSGAASSAFNNDSSQDSLPVQSPNLLRKKFISKQQNQIK